MAVQCKGTVVFFVLFLFFVFFCREFLLCVRDVGVLVCRSNLSIVPTKRIRDAAGTAV